MHEAGIVINIIDLVKESIPRDELKLLESIELRMGKMCNVLPEALEFCFRSFVENTPLNNINLIIEEMDLDVYCRDCGESSHSSDFIFSCPKCRNNNLEIIGGNDLVISKLHLKREGELI